LITEGGTAPELQMEPKADHTGRLGEREKFFEADPEVLCKSQSPLCSK